MTATESAGLRKSAFAVAPGSPLQRQLRVVNSQIAELATGTTAAFVCECDDRRCAEAIEAPLAIFLAVEQTMHVLLVRPGHEVPPLDRVVKREPGYLVVGRGGR